MAKKKLAGVLAAVIVAFSGGVAVARSRIELISIPAKIHTLRDDDTLCGAEDSGLVPSLKTGYHTRIADGWVYHCANLSDWANRNF